MCSGGCDPLYTIGRKVKMTVFISVSLIMFEILVVSAEQIIKVEIGETTTLPCRAPGDGHVTLVEWNRPGLGTDYVLVFRRGKTDTDLQHSYYTDRASLRDSHFKARDVSLVIKNVTTNDT